MENEQTAAIRDDEALAAFSDERLVEALYRRVITRQLDPGTRCDHNQQAQVMLEHARAHLSARTPLSVAYTRIQELEKQLAEARATAAEGDHQ
jgi:hypothetical protein